MANSPARTKNSRASSSNGKKSIDITAYIKDQTGYDPKTEVVTYEEIDLFDESFRIITEVNVANLLMMGDNEDTAALIKGLARFVHPDDRSAFKTLIAGLPNFDADDLLALIQGITSVASEGKAPTSSGASSRGTRSRVVETRSVGD